MDEYYTAQEAARILRTTERTVRRRLERGDLEGSRDQISGRWKVLATSVTEAMPDRPPKEPESALEASQEAAELFQVVQDLQRQLGRLEGQRELQEVAGASLESTLREQLLRERGRADRLEDELREARRTWWQRLFGR